MRRSAGLLIAVLAVMLAAACGAAGAHPTAAGNPAAARNAPSHSGGASGVPASGLAAAGSASPAASASPVAPASPATTSPPPPPVTHRTLMPGMRGADVKALQRRLAALKYYPGPADGRFGADTQEAVWAFE